VTRELQVVGKAASIAIQTWVRNNDKTKARAEEREKNVGWITRLFKAWRVSHAERADRASFHAHTVGGHSSRDSAGVSTGRHRRSAAPVGGDGGRQRA